MKVVLLKAMDIHGVPMEVDGEVEIADPVAEIYIREGWARPAPVVIEVDDCEQVLECNL
jgi:hypothetical protein